MANEIELTKIIVMCVLVMMCAYQSLLASQFSAMRALDRYYCDAIDMVLVCWERRARRKRALEADKHKSNRKRPRYWMSLQSVSSQSIYDLSLL